MDGWAAGRTRVGGGGGIGGGISGAAAARRWAQVGPVARVVGGGGLLAR